MPVAQHPDRPEFYVYALEALGSVFYVGIGRSGRASDRIRWVKSQMKREAAGRKGKWVLHMQVIAELLKGGHDIQVWYLQPATTRKEALAAEKVEIKRLLSAGVVLANCQYNGGGPPAHTVVQSILKNRIGRTDPKII